MCHALVTPGYISEWLHWPKCSKKPSVSRMTSRKNPRSSSCVTSSLTMTPSMLMRSLRAPGDSCLFVDAVGAHEVADRVVGLDRLAGVAPEPLENVVLHRPSVEVPVVDVSDLELSAA